MVGEMRGAHFVSHMRELGEENVGEMENIISYKSSL